MTRLFLILAAVCLTMTAVPSVSAAQTEADGSRPEGAESAEASAETLLPPVFQLATQPEDSPEMAVKKAALRLFHGYSLTTLRLTACQVSEPTAKRALDNFSSRNGNTLAMALRAVKALGGVTADAKEVIDRDLEGLARESVDCRALAEAVSGGEKDLYKGPEYIDDYRLVQSLKK